MNIRPPKGPEVNACYELELAYSSASPSALEDGFFLPGVQLSTYEELNSAGGLLASFGESGDLSSYALCVPAGHTIVKGLLADRNKIILFDEKSADDSENCVWIAKVATQKADRRRGFARSLYHELFKQHLGRDILTATALSPLRNVVSERFHEHMGMKRVGVYLSGTRGELSHIVNTVWHKR